MLAPHGALLVSTPQWQGPDLRRFHVREYRGRELAETLGRQFGRVRVQASEPGRLQDALRDEPGHTDRREPPQSGGDEPVHRAAEPGAARAGWRQLVAIADEQ